jgi:hypothetical protein
VRVHPSGGHLQWPTAEPASADSLRWNLDLILDQRGADMVAVPGGASGILARDYKGKEADWLVTRIDPGVVSLSRNSAATGGGLPRNWAGGRPAAEKRKVIDVSPAAITLALLLTDEELDSLEKGLELEKSRGDPVD